MHQAIYEQLLSVAKAGGCTTYSEIAPLANLDMSNPADRSRISDVLGAISTFEHEHGRPLLSAIVILRDDDMPGQGFFTLARELRIYHGKDDLAFFIAELRRVHDYWAHV